MIIRFLYCLWRIRKHKWEFGEIFAEMEDEEDDE